MQSTKKQHYVPRLYLKQWVDSNERIWCLDREKGCIFNPNVMGVAQERFFYEMQQLRTEDFFLLEKLWVESKTLALKVANQSYLNIFKAYNNLLKKMSVSDNPSVRSKKEWVEKNFVEKMFAAHEGKYLSLIKTFLAQGIPNWNDDDQISFLFFF